MGHVAIQAEGLRKRYRLGQQSSYRSLRDAIAGGVSGALGRSKGLDVPARRGWFWALDGVDLHVDEGEIVGIIGRNGAGKSTLLKVLSRITRPTEGTARIRGRVGSLLEVGTGFHPELTGRENVFLNGAILGMPKREIQRRFDEIVAFAETERFIDMQVKHYSSGMQVRLAFAVAAHLEPHVLLVDEVLAVGDAAFQRKCLGRMDEVARSGRTVMFVSHNLGAVVRLCSRSLWIDKGRLVEEGPSRQVIDSYLSADLEGEGERRWEHEPPGDDHLRLRSLRVCQPEGVVRSSVDLDHPFQIEMDFDVTSPRDEKDVVAIRVLGRDGQVVIHSAEVWSEGAPRRTEPGRWRTICRIPANVLNVGTYTLSVGADVPQSRIIFGLDNAIAWTVEAGGPQPGNYDPRSWAGSIAPALVSWETSRESDR